MLAGCREAILHDLSEREANRVLTALDDVRLGGRKERQPDGRWAISVRSQDQLQALAAVEQTPGIRERAVLQEEGASLLSPREYQRFSLERRLSRELEETLITLRGVVEARVHLNLPLVEAGFARAMSRAPVSAGVVLVVDPSAHIEREMVEKVVAGASGVTPAAVSVLLVQAPRRAISPDPSHTTQPVRPSPEERVAPAALLLALLFSAGVVLRRCWFVRALDQSAQDEQIVSDVRGHEAAGTG